MSGSPKAQNLAMQERATNPPDGEPKWTYERSVQERGGGTLYHSVPKMVCDDIGLDGSKDVTIEWYDNGYFVRVADQEE